MHIYFVKKKWKMNGSTPVYITIHTVLYRLAITCITKIFSKILWNTQNLTISIIPVIRDPPSPPPKKNLIQKKTSWFFFNQAIFFLVNHTLTVVFSTGLKNGTKTSVWRSRPQLCFLSSRRSLQVSFRLRYHQNQKDNPQNQHVL